jgi:hypothetical protein
VKARLGEPQPRAGASAAAYARYLRDRDSYARDLTLYYRQQYRYEDASHRTVPLHIMIVNKGQRRAENVTIVFRLPAGLTPVRQEIHDFNHEMPDEPRSLGEYENPEVRRALYVPAERVLRAGSDFTNPEAVRLPDGSWTLERRLPYGIAAQDVHHDFDVRAQFRDWDSVRPFDFDVTVRVDTGAPVTTTLRVNATVVRER